MKPAYTGFFLGNYPQASLLEIESVFARENLPLKPLLLNPHLAAVSYNESLSALSSILGGTVKIGDLYLISLQEVSPLIAKDLNRTQHTKACFFSNLKDFSSQEFAQAVKKSCRENNLNLHFRLPQIPQNTAGIGKVWADYLLYPYQDNLCLLFITRSVQDIALWTQKDYHRPFAAPEKGMLPPKLARIMVNLGIHQRSPAQTILYDPFCGSGTILIEALDLGVKKTLGSDVSPSQIQHSHANCRWFCDAQKIETHPYQCFVKDVMSLTPSDLENLPDTIVFEGYLGPPHLRQAQIPGQIKGLTKMYHGVFKRLKPLLKPNSRLVCALPAFQQGNETTTLKALIDTCENLGYTFPGPPLIVGRPNALIKREILVMNLK